MKHVLRTSTYKLTLLAFLLLSSPVFSQSCALCYTQAASAGARMIEALRSGILILALPPTIASIAMLFVVHHKRNQVRQIDDKDGSQRGW